MRKPFYRALPKPWISTPQSSLDESIEWLVAELSKIFDLSKIEIINRD